MALLLTVLSGIQAVHRARAGRSALIKWRPAVEALWAGQPIYGAADEDSREGFPTLPITAIALTPFLALGDLGGALAWALFKLGLAWWCVLTALRLAAGRARDFPPLAALAVVLLCWRVFASDIAHGNVNLVVAAVLTAAALEWQAGRDLRAGLWIGLGAALKVTPLLFVLFFVYRRSTRALGGVLLGGLLCVLLAPGLLLGWEHNLSLVAGWWQQMIAPYLAGTPPGLMQSEHINQSLLGVLTRVTTAAVAIPAHPPRYPTDVYVNVLALSPAALVWLHRAVALMLLGLLAWWLRPAGKPRAARSGARVLCDWSLVTLAMLMLSERSWKQHYVTVFLPIAWLAWCAFNARLEPGRRRTAWIGSAASLLAFALSGSGVLGARGSDLAESWGVFFWGALALFVCCGRLAGVTRGAAA